MAAECATSSLPVNMLKSPEYGTRAAWYYTLGSQSQFTSNCLIFTAEIWMSDSPVSVAGM